MIKNISVENFKSLKDINVSIKPLNLLMGLNGMGKSSFIQSLLLLMQSENLDKRIISLKGSLFDIGLGRDALYQYSNEDFFTIGIGFDDLSEFKWRFKYQNDKDELISENGYSSSLMKVFYNSTNNFQFISAERIGAQDLYEASSIIVADKKQIGLSGEYAAYYLNIHGYSFKVNEKLRHASCVSPILLDQLNSWMGEVSPGIVINTKYVPEINKVILDYQYTFQNTKTNSFKSKNVGFGITYVLPVLLSLLTAERGKIIVIENPESHIHPKGQAELGKLIALAANTGAQLFIETHSDHILNGVRVAVKENNIENKSVNIMYFDKETTESEQYSRITQINTDKNGELSEYPKDFLDEWNNQLLKLI